MGNSAGGRHPAPIPCFRTYSGCLLRSCPGELAGVHGRGRLGGGSGEAAPASGFLQTPGDPCYCAGYFLLGEDMLPMLGPRSPTPHAGGQGALLGSMELRRITGRHWRLARDW